MSEPTADEADRLARSAIPRAGVEWEAHRQKEIKALSKAIRAYGRSQALAAAREMREQAAKYLQDRFGGAQGWALAHEVAALPLEPGGQT